jgi:hypothetical protein
MWHTLNSIAMVIGYITIYLLVVVIILSTLFGMGIERKPKNRHKEFYKGKNFTHLNK